MEVLGKNILLISPEKWGKSKVSKHHYALELSKSNNVYFLNPNTTQFKLESITNSLTVVYYRELLKGVSFFPKTLQQIYFLILFKFLEKKTGVKFDVIWNFDSSRFYNLKFISDDTLKICHIVDMSENFNRDMLAKTSDICFCTSNHIKRKIVPFNKNVHVIHHGYQEFGHDFDINLTNADIQIGFVGNLTRTCIDWELVVSLIKDFPQCQFNLIGGYTEHNLALKGLNPEILDFLQTTSNVTLFGEVVSEKIPSVLKKMDVLIIPYFVRNNLERAQHSSLHKTIEYLGSGKVILSCYQDEYREFGELILMALTKEDFHQIFLKIVNNLNQYNSEKSQSLRKQFALQNTYSKQLKKCQKLLIR